MLDLLLGAVFGLALLAAVAGVTGLLMGVVAAACAAVIGGLRGEGER